MKKKDNLVGEERSTWLNAPSYRAPDDTQQTNHGEPHWKLRLMDSKIGNVYVAVHGFMWRW